MFTRRKKMESNSGAARPESILLRLFRSSDVFPSPLVSPENTDREDLHIEDQKMIRRAMLETEYQNFRALLAFQNNKRFC